MLSLQRALPILYTLLVYGCVPADQGNTEQEAEGSQPSTSASDPTPTVILETNLGRIVVELDREKAPRSVASFLRHVGAGFYDGLVFHRVISGFMIQAGTLTADRQVRTSTSALVPNEADNGLLNSRGTIALARTSDPNSAKAEFFINLVDNDGLDHKDRSVQGWGYAVFGHVTEGMAVVDAIGASPTQRWNRYADLPVEPIVVERAYVVDEAN